MILKKIINFIRGEPSIVWVQNYNKGNNFFRKVLYLLAFISIINKQILQSNYSALLWA